MIEENQLKLQFTVSISEIEEFMFQLNGDVYNVLDIF